MNQASEDDVKFELNESEWGVSWFAITVIILIYAISFIWIPACEKEESAERKHEILMKEEPSQ